MNDRNNIVSLKITLTFIYILLNLSLILSANTDNNVSNNGRSINVEVKYTVELKVNFIPVDWDVSSLIYINSAEENIEFINATYPLFSGQFLPEISVKHFSFGLDEYESLTDSDMSPLLKRLYRETRLGGKDYDRVVGIVPEDWFNRHNLTNVGEYSYPRWTRHVRGSNNCECECDLK